MIGIAGKTSMYLAMKQLFFSLILIFSLFSCQKSDELTPETKSKIISIVEARLNASNRAVKLNGLTAKLDYLDNSEDFFWTPPGYSQALNYSQFSEATISNADNYTKITYLYDSLKIIPLTRNIVVYSGTIRSTMIDKLGNRTAFSLVETGTMIKRKKKWMFLNGQTSLITN